MPQALRSNNRILSCKGTNGAIGPHRHLPSRVKEGACEINRRAALEQEWYQASRAAHIPLVGFSQCRSKDGLLN